MMVQSLFNETYLLRPNLQGAYKDDLGYRPIFTLRTSDFVLGPSNQFYRDNDSNLLKSIYQLYLEYNDPSEYSFAQGTFGQDGWTHWLKIRKCSFFKDIYEKMQAALRAKLEAEAIQAVRQVAQTVTGTQALQAAKWLHDAVQPKKGKGRPSKEQITLEAKKLAQEEKDAGADGARIGLEVETQVLSDVELEILGDLDV